MSASELLNGLGLLFGMVGATILYFRGPPQPAFGQVGGLRQEDVNVTERGTFVGEELRNDELRRKHYLNLSRIGFSLLAIGFVSQFAALVIQHIQRH